MSEWRTLALGYTSWLPSGLLQAEQAWPLLTTTPTSRLGDVALVRAVSSPLREQLPIVTPRSIDVSTGQLAPATCADGGDGLVLGTDLRADDILVPAYGDAPCIRVSDELIGIGFRGFLVVRPTSDVVSSEWLWAVLSSASGARARRAVMTGAVLRGVSASALRELPVPLKPPHTLDLARLLPHPLVLESQGAWLRSSWHLRDLRRAPVWSGSTTEQPEPDGVQLADLGRIWMGRVDKQDWFGTPGPGRLPVLTHRAVRGHSESFRPWASPGGPATTDATVVFTRTGPFRVLHAPSGMLLSKELIALDLDDSRPAIAVAAVYEAVSESLALFTTRLASYLASDKGSDKLAAAASGAVLQHLSLSALRSLRVDLVTVQAAAKTAANERLAEQLERALRGTGGR